MPSPRSMIVIVCPNQQALYICEECENGSKHRPNKIVVQQDHISNVLFNRIMTNLRGVAARPPYRPLRSPDRSSSHQGKKLSGASTCRTLAHVLSLSACRIRRISPVSTVCKPYVPLVLRKIILLWSDVLSFLFLRNSCRYTHSQAYRQTVVVDIFF